jgi:AmiR/NasT family two-component response regulator
MRKPFAPQVTPQSVEERLAEVDRVILTTSKDGCELLARGAPVAEVDVITDFLRDLYDRRETILFELKKLGISEKEAYKHLRNKSEGGAAI